MNETDRSGGGAVVRPDYIPDTAECVADVWVYQWPGDSNVHFQGDSGVEGFIDRDGLTLEVEDEERGRDWEGDVAHNRMLPMAALRRALAMYDAERGDL